MVKDQFVVGEIVVWDETQEGVVVEIDDTFDFPVKVAFSKDPADYLRFTAKGQLYHDWKYPRLERAKN